MYHFVFLSKGSDVKNKMQKIFTKIAKNMGDTPLKNCWILETTRWDWAVLFESDKSFYLKFSCFISFFSQEIKALKEVEDKTKVILKFFALSVVTFPVLVVIGARKQQFVLGIGHLNRESKY